MTEHVSYNSGIPSHWPHRYCTARCAGNLACSNHQQVQATAQATAPTLQEIEGDSNSEDVLDYNKAEKTNVLDYLHDASSPQAVKHNIAEYFATGNKALLRLSDEHFKHYFHTATALHFDVLVKECLKWYKGSERKAFLYDSVAKYQECIDALEDAESSVQNTHADIDGNDNHTGNTELAVLFLKGGQSNPGQQVLVMDMKDNYSMLKLQVKKVNKFGSGYACCSIQYKDCPYIIISGGTGKNANYIRKYDVILNKWTSHKYLKTRRSDHMMAFANGQIYVIGGDECQGTFEVYNPNCKCTANGRLIHAVEEACYVVYKDNIYVFGGKGRHGKTNHVQCINTRTNKVHELPSIPCEFSGGQAVVVKDKIFIATGQGHMIEFDPQMQTSNQCSRQPFPRKHFVLFVEKGKVCIFGGLRFDGTGEDENSMYKYDPVRDCWRRMLTFKKTLPVYTSCYVQYSKQYPVMPFVADY